MQCNARSSCARWKVDGSEGVGNGGTDSVGIARHVAWKLQRIEGCWSNRAFEWSGNQKECEVVAGIYLVLPA